MLSDEREKIHQIYLSDFIFFHFFRPEKAKKPCSTIKQEINLYFIATNNVLYKSLYD